MRKALCRALILPCIVAASASWALGEPLLVRARTGATVARAAPPGYTREITAAPAGCGTVNPKAKVATVTVGEGNKVMIALDSDDASAADLDLVRFDVTAKGRFKGAPTAPLALTRQSTSYRYHQFGPILLKLPRGGKSLPTLVTGYYYVRTGSSAYEYVRLTYNAAAVTSCRFGDKVYGVRVADGDRNLRLGDEPGLSLVDGRVVNKSKSRYAVGGDTIAIDTTSKTFKTGKVQIPCGQLARVDGAWFRVTANEDGSKVSVKPVKVETGQILVPGDQWSIVLIGTKHVLKLSGRKEPVDVPVDQYVAANYQGSTASGVAAKPHRLTSGRYVISGRTKAKVFEVKAGQVTKVPVGGPLLATMSASEKAGTVRLSALVTDASGARVSSLYGPTGRPPAPTVTIYNDKREKIYTTTLKYG